MIPLVKVNLPRREILMEKLEEVLYSGQIAEGELVYKFEDLFLTKYNYTQGVALSSGTAALHLALLMSDVKYDDEVISTPMTAEPTNTAITQVGGRVVWADVDPASGNIDPDSIAGLVTSKTKAIIVVHYAGYPARMSEIREVAKEHGIRVIEDCAHALGARYEGQFIGSQSDFAIFSFQAIKHMTTVDGGFLLFKDQRHLETAKRMRWFGMLKGVPRTEVDLTIQGFKYNMTNVTAQIGISHLQGNIDELISKHIYNGRYYDSKFNQISGVDFARCEPFADSSYWLYTLLSDKSDAIEKALIAKGITASKLHRPNHLHSFFKKSYRDLPGVNAFYRRLLHIPCGWWVSDKTRIEIVEVIRKEVEG